MARIDKYNGVSGGFRARLAFAVAAGDVGDIIAVDLDNSGQVIKAVAAADAEGVVCPTSVMSIGDVIDVMTHGEIVDIGAGNNVTGAAAGTPAYAAAGGGINVTAPGAGVNSTRIGTFVEAWRLVVRVQKAQG